MFMVFCNPYPCVIVSQFVSPGLFDFVNLDEFIEVIFPSFYPRPELLLVFVVEIRLGFHVATLFVHRSSLCVAILVASRHFSFPLWLDPASIIESLHFLFRLVCTSFDVLDPVFYFFVCSTRIVVCIALKGGVAVLVTSEARAPSIFRPCGQSIVATDTSTLNCAQSSCAIASCTLTSCQSISTSTVNFCMTFLPLSRTIRIQPDGFSYNSSLLLATAVKRGLTAISGSSKSDRAL